MNKLHLQSNGMAPPALNDYYIRFGVNGFQHLQMSAHNRNAFATAKLGAILTKQLTDAHENQSSDYPYNYKENDMDSFNNEAGRAIGAESNFMLMIKVKLAIANGRLRYLNNLNPANNQATASSKLIPTN